MSLISNTNS
jgi:hypothetical protein